MTKLGGLEAAKPAGLLSELLQQLPELTIEVCGRAGVCAGLLGAAGETNGVCCMGYQPPRSLPQLLSLLPAGVLCWLSPAGSTGLPGRPGMHSQRSCSAPTPSPQPRPYRRTARHT